MRNEYKILVGIEKGKDSFGGLGVDSIILKLISN
jgi:hypothetical protein